MEEESRRLVVCPPKKPSATAVWKYQSPESAICSLGIMKCSPSMHL